MPVTKSSMPMDLRDGDRQPAEPARSASEAEQTLEEIEAEVNALVGLTDSAEDAARSPRSQTPPVAPPVAAAASKAHAPTLEEIDEALAEDADDVLASAFTSVEDLLGESFDEDVPAEPAEPALPDETARAEAASAPAEPSQPPPTAAAPESPVPSADDPPDPSPAAAHGQAPAVAAKDHQPVAAESSPAKAASEPPSAKTAELVNSPKPPPRRAARPAWMANERLIALVMRILSILAWPLTFVPESCRPYVDWIALSIVFWVPVVWVVALFVIGR